MNYCIDLNLGFQTVYHVHKNIMNEKLVSHDISDLLPIASNTVRSLTFNGVVLERKFNKVIPVKDVHEFMDML